MYYVFQSDVKSVRNTILQARLDVRPNIHTNWINGEKLTEKPIELEFTVSYDNVPYPDNFFTGSEFDLYSENLVQILSDFNIPFESFAVVIKSKKSIPIEKIYKNFRLLSVEDAVDEKRSTISLTKIKKIILKNYYYEKSFYMFRLKTRLNIVIIHEEVKNKILSSGITGCKFIPISDFQLGLF
jgi:hypothetical protein